MVWIKHLLILYPEYQFYKWIRSNTIDRFYVDPEAEKANNATPIVSSAWKEREDALGSLQRYLSDIPSTPTNYVVGTNLVDMILDTVTFLHGPQGSGKSRMLAAILKDTKRFAFWILRTRILSTKAHVGKHSSSMSAHWRRLVQTQRSCPLSRSRQVIGLSSPS